MLASIRRPTFEDLNLSTGKRARLYDMMYAHGPANGTLMLLPIDQGLEHGPIDFFDNPDALDTDWVLRLAVEGNFSGIVSVLYGLGDAAAASSDFGTFSFTMSAPISHATRAA